MFEASRHRLTAFSLPRLDPLRLLLTFHLYSEMLRGQMHGDLIFCTLDGLEGASNAMFERQKGQQGFRMFMME